MVFAWFISHYPSFRLFSRHAGFGPLLALTIGNHCMLFKSIYYIYILSLDLVLFYIFKGYNLEIRKFR